MEHNLATAALRASGITAGHIGLLHREFNDHVETFATSPAGWHGADDIETLVGLEGTFQWFESPLVPRLMTFKFDPGSSGVQGKYQLEGGGPTEFGTFHSVPNNPAIGWAFIGLAPNGSAARTFIVSGMMTDAQWTISIALLNKVGDNGPIQPAFSVIRQVS